MVGPTAVSYTHLDVYKRQAYGPGTEDEKEEYKEEEPAKVIDLNLDPDQTFANPDTPSTPCLLYTSYHRAKSRTFLAR